jgi:hypothetical protein
MTLRSTLAALALVLWLAALASLGAAAPQSKQHTGAQGNIQITLNRDFIDTYKDRVTITADDFVIDIAHKKPNPGSKDGDMHVAGRAESIGLPIVAEIMNAKDQKKAMDRVHDLEGGGKAVQAVGAWRLWCEHAFSSKQVQGAPLKQPFTTTNPPHVFEIHPLTRLDGMDLRSSFKPIPGFKPKDAHDAFVTYENIRCEIRPGKDAHTIVTSMAGYNYVEFILELNESPFKLDDGYSVLCKVRDLEGELLVHNRRMLFVDGTEPADKVKGLQKGNRMQVLGLPRIDLALVDWRVLHANDPRWKEEDPLHWNLPYEIIVVAVTGTPKDEE